MDGLSLDCLHQAMIKRRCLARFFGKVRPVLDADTTSSLPFRSTTTVLIPGLLFLLKFSKDVGTSFRFGCS